MPFSVPSPPNFLRLAPSVDLVLIWLDTWLQHARPRLPKALRKSVRHGHNCTPLFALSPARPLKAMIQKTFSMNIAQDVLNQVSEVGLLLKRLVLRVNLPYLVLQAAPAVANEKRQRKAWQHLRIDSAEDREATLAARFA